MLLLTGITGRVGGAAARALLAKGEPLRALVRDGEKAAPWAGMGVDLRLGDLTDKDALAEALDGVEAAFLMQPTPTGVTREFSEGKALTAGIIGALERKPPPRAVILSSVGSEQPSGLGNITQTYMLEQALRRFSFPIAVVRAGAFLENNLASLDRAKETGVFNSFLQPTDRSFPMVASADIGAEVARLMLEHWDGRRTIELGSPFTPENLARAMGEALGRSVEAHPILRDAWPAVLARMGLSADEAANWEEMQDGFNSGWIDFGKPGTEAVPSTTSAAEVFADALKRKAGWHA